MGLRCMPRSVVNTPFGYIEAVERSDEFDEVRDVIQTLPVVPDLTVVQDTEKCEM
jgi:hypothetical protein